MATALSVSPVPFDDDGYAEYQLEQCWHDQNRFDQVLTIISILAAATVFFQRIRNKEHRKFPDNIFTMSLVSLCGIHLALLISIASKNKVVLLDDNPWRSLCHLQATMFHWCACAAIWNIICVIVTLHRVIVYKVAVADLVHYSRAYYLSLVLLPSIAVGACWSFGGGYGPYPGLHNCWIKPGAGRLLFFHSFTILGFTSFLALGPPTVLALWRAYHNASQATSASLFKSLMLRHVLLAIYGLAVVTTFLLGGLNNMLLSSHKDSTYIKRSAYPICIFSAINFASLGLFVSLIYWSTKHQTQVIRDTINKVVNLSWCARPTTHKMDEDECPLESIEVHHKMPEPIVKLSARHAPLTISTVRLSPRNSTASECEFRSAFDSAARSITSIPPDPQHRRAKEIATNAYTSTLLEYVREQLLDELNGEDSDWSESSAYDDDLSSRASELSMEELLSHTESSYPASPLSNFHEFSPCHAARSPDSEELARRATITDL